MLNCAGFQLPERKRDLPKTGRPRFAAPLMLRALGDYGRLMVFPGNLHMERSIFDPDNYLNRESWRKTAASEYLSILGLVVWRRSSMAARERGIGQRMRIMGAVWFFAAYLPISNIVQLNATVAEHWLYLPSVGFLIFLAGCALGFAARSSEPV